MIVLKVNFNLFMKIKEDTLCLEQNVNGWKTVNVGKNFFFNMEKRNYNKKTISELRLQDESTTTNEKKFLDHIENYYKNLFTSEATFSQVECDKFTQHLEIPKLSDQDRDSLEGPLSYERRM